MPRDERYAHVRAGPVELPLIVNSSVLEATKARGRGDWAKGVVESWGQSHLKTN